MSEFAMLAHLGAIQQYDDLCMTIMRKVADGGSLADVLQIVGDAMNACDHVDDENVALWNEAHTAALDVAARLADLRERVEALTAALRGILDWEGDHAEYLGQCAADLAKWPCPFERARRLLGSGGEE